MFKPGDKVRFKSEYKRLSKQYYAPGVLTVVEVKRGHTQWSDVLLFEGKKGKIDWNYACHFELVEEARQQFALQLPTFGSFDDAVAAATAVAKVLNLPIPVVVHEPS